MPAATGNLISDSYEGDSSGPEGFREPNFDQGFRIAIVLEGPVCIVTDPMK
jgi:hypothetical protein